MHSQILEWPVDGVIKDLITIKYLINVLWKSLRKIVEKSAGSMRLRKQRIENSLERILVINRYD